MKIGFYINRQQTLRVLSNMYLNVKKILSITVLTLISGCTLVPGGHLAVNNWIEDPSLDIEPEVNVKMITPSLLSEISFSEALPKTNSALVTDIGEYTYKIGKGDILNITVWDHPELTTPAGQFRSAGESGNVVNSDGMIFYPYVGRVSVLNMTVGEVRDLITVLLGQYIKNPQIDVSIAAFRSQRVFVTGAVNAPSVMPITNIPLTVLDAINHSGGLSAGADWRSVVLTSETVDGPSETTIDLHALYEKGDMTQNRLLKNNDLLHIPVNDSLKVFVMGDVVNPSTQQIGRSHMSLAEALNNAGGINEQSANSSGIFILRANEDSDSLVDVFRLDASEGTMLILSTQFKLKPLDIVYVTSAPVARWNRVISQLIPTFNLLRLSGQARTDFDE